MINPFTLDTPWLRLRPLELSDTSAIQRAASAREIADTMISLPHPYPAGEADRYVAKLEAERKAGHSVAFVIDQQIDDTFCGLIEIRKINRAHSQGELSFWLTAETWGQGYMIEVVQAVVRYGFVTLGLNRLYAYHMWRNPASGRVLEKNGFRQEGLLRQRVKKWGQFEDVLLWAILKQDWLAMTRRKDMSSAFK